MIRAAKISEAEEIAALVNSAYRGEKAFQGWTTEAEFLDGQRTDAEILTKELGNPNKTILCYKENENAPITGCVFLESLPNEKSFHLGMLTVKPDLQSKGLGRVILESAEKYAIEHGATRMQMNVIHIRASLIAWYERRGYRATDKRAPFPYGDEKAGLPRRDDLYFIIFEKSL